MDWLDLLHPEAFLCLLQPFGCPSRYTGEAFLLQAQRHVALHPTCALPGGMVPVSCTASCSHCFQAAVKFSLLASATVAHRALWASSGSETK